MRLRGVFTAGVAALLLFFELALLAAVDGAALSKLLLSARADDGGSSMERALERPRRTEPVFSLFTALSAALPLPVCGSAVLADPLSSVKPPIMSPAKVEKIDGDSGEPGLLSGESDLGPGDISPETSRKATGAPEAGAPDPILAPGCLSLYSSSISLSLDMSRLCRNTRRMFSRRSSSEDAWCENAEKPCSKSTFSCGVGLYSWSASVPVNPAAIAAAAVAASAPAACICIMSFSCLLLRPRFDLTVSCTVSGLLECGLVTGGRFSIFIAVSGDFDSLRFLLSISLRIIRSIVRLRAASSSVIVPGPGLSDIIMSMAPSESSMSSPRPSWPYGSPWTPTPRPAWPCIFARRKKYFCECVRTWVAVRVATYSEIALTSLGPYFASPSRNRWCSAGVQ
eukprot:comp21563_c0_seq1/m.47281 comp21563_c0_seq1/g.47281  ORF comp21563_c0_seq1/g.47281 comp21563_c0_seq1/m.47281 type:complete len:397 (+) comp21563_c0_seq1:310-1500(+)